MVLNINNQPEKFVPKAVRGPKAANKRKASLALNFD